MKLDQTTRKQIKITIVLALVALGIRLFSFRSDWVETYYSSGIYPWIGSGMRQIFGWLPFSFGDFLYLFIVICVLYLIFRWGKKLVKKAVKLKDLIPTGLQIINFLLLVYIYFNVFWGLNYNRLGISYQLQLAVNEQPSLPKLSGLTNQLLNKTNSFASTAGRKWHEPDSKVFEGSIKSYQKLGSIYPFLEYHPRSIKSSLFGVLGNYMGYTGYYNPFTAEAQINNAVPDFLHPFVACHEIAHQLGYAKENEANFVGFLAARASDDSAFLYSVYLDMFLYANAELFRTDSLLARGNYKKLLPEVQRDLAELRAFRIKYENPIDRLISYFYDGYLKMNQQPAGSKTYSKVILWLLAYYDKFGEI